MASQATQQAANTTGQGSPQQLNQIVMEYLSKKGYVKTEAMLRVESLRTDSDGRPIVSRPNENPDQIHEKAYEKLKEWIDNSLDIYKPELGRVLYPLFVHFYLDLLTKGFTTSARRFWQTFSRDHTALHNHDLQALSVLSLPQHVEDNALARLYRENKYRVSLSEVTKNLLLFALQADRYGEYLTLRILNDHIEIKVHEGRPGMLSVQGSETLASEDGIRGHSSGTVSEDRLAEVKLGALPMDKDMILDVEDEIRNEPPLVDEFNRIKREESEDSPMRDAVPLPPYTIVDVEREVKAIKESLEVISLKQSPGPAQPSVCMFTFHNSNDGLHCIDFSDDSRLVACGFSESYVRIFSLKGTPLPSAVPSENLSYPPKSRRLIGHSGPVYGVSFSPDQKYLLSCSEDKSVRLWSMDTYSALVAYKGHDAPIWDVKFGPFGHYFATASHDHTARLWSCDHIYPLRIFAGHTSDVDCVTFHPNSAYVFTGSSDRTARMWDVQTGASVRVFVGHTAPISTLEVSPNGQLLATAAEDAMINIWDIATGKLLKTMKGHGRIAIHSLSFSKDGCVLVSGSADATVRCWDVNFGTRLSSAEPAEQLNRNGHPGAANDGIAKLDNVGMVNGKRKAGKDVVATLDQLAVWYTKRAQVYKVKFTNKNVVLAGSAFIP